MMHQNGEHTARISPRHPWRAFLLSFVLPGLGQLYNGQINKAAWFYLLFAFFTIPAVAWLLMYLPPEWTLYAMLGSFVLSMLVWLASLLDAWRVARKQPAYVAGIWQGMGLYLLVLVVCGGLALPLLGQYVRENILEAFRIPSASMEPTMVAGDFIYADKRYNCRGCQQKVERGDIVTFVYPNDRTVNYIKRVIGLPGDRIQVRGQAVWVNGKSISGKPVRNEGLDVVEESDGSNRWAVVWKDTGRKLPQSELTIPPGEVFVMGDNRANSNDSRYFGTVPLDDIFGKARQVWLSYNGTLGGLLLKRSGLVVH